MQLMTSMQGGVVLCRELDGLPKNVDLALSFKQDGNRNYVPIMEVLNAEHQQATSGLDNGFGKGK